MAASTRKPSAQPSALIHSNRFNFWPSITATTLGALILSTAWLRLGADEAVTVTFLTLAFAQLWHVFNMRGKISGPLRNEVTRNPYVWAALALCIVLLLAAVHAPVLSDVLRTVPPDARGWAVIAAMSLVPLIAGQGLMLLHRAKS